MFAALMRSFFSLVLFLFFISTVLLFGGSCANIIPPAGGPRDSLPPQIVRAIPADSTLNFKGKKIELVFDEYVDLQDVSNNLLVTPTFEVPPPISVRAKTITINFKDSLEPNTTYIFNFGNAIKDMNEGNVLRNFVYTFSTGPVLDSLELSGKVILAQNGRVDSTMIVVLNKDLTDSAVRNKLPQYVSRLDANGNFRFHNLPSGTFAIYALGGDAVRSKKYFNAKDLFAFADTPVATGKDYSITLYAYQTIPTSTLPTSGALPGIRTGAGSEKRLTFNTNLKSNQQDLLSDLTMNFTTPLRNFDTSKISLSTDSSFTPVSFSAQLDSTRKQIRFHTQWKENSKYNLVLNKDFAEDTTGKKLLKSDTLNFTTRKQADYGNLILRIRNLDSSKNPVLQFVQNDQVVLSASIKSGVYTNPMFLPGDYDLRILFDTNNNGIWDAGEFFKNKKQPELVKPIPQKITVKAAWDNEIERSL